MMTFAKLVSSYFHKFYTKKCFIQKRYLCKISYCYVSNKILYRCLLFNTIKKLVITMEIFIIGFIFKIINFVKNNYFILLV